MKRRVIKKRIKMLLRRVQRFHERFADHCFRWAHWDGTLKR